MRYIKKSLAVLLAAILVMSVCPLSALAAVGDKTGSYEYGSYINMTQQQKPFT